MMDCYWINLVIVLIISWNLVIDKHFSVGMGEKEFEIIPYVTGSILLENFIWERGAAGKV
jgi:hypothetical protein